MDQETKPGYEPDRIPHSVFATSVTPKQEWSIQSNESLFSIHMGDHSFSKMYKSGELTNFEYTASPYISYYNNNIDNKIAPTDAGTKEVNITMVETGPKTGNRDGLTNVPKPDPRQQIPISPTKSCHSETSNNSTTSFAFPTLGEYQQERKTSLNTKSESGKRELSRLDSKTGLYPDDSKQGGAGAGVGGWLSCCLCFSVKN
ncbi:hypothetical protein AtNW77_Chr5g0121081 [Arabidopsis thaliana]|uniref:Uncharacterized protein n=3 Tax=Arabidopsis TaxID=3701 RepID=A0A178U8H2_ARATH|nr:hypothetical protein ISN45_At05g033490 [Arabidopsis thaliana x Arabidopsis arenosa]OAO89950.1 hypothetical protein AXX17_AT5G36600 [Arabidopsis thaliana]